MRSIVKLISQSSTKMQAYQESFGFCDDLSTVGYDECLDLLLAIHNEQTLVTDSTKVCNMMMSII